MAERPPLSFDTLLPLLVDGDDHGTVELLRGRSEDERRLVGRRLAAGLRGGGTLDVRVDPETAAAAVLGTATLTDVKRLSHMHKWGRYASEATFEVLADRKPPWLRQWLEFCLEHEARASGRAEEAFSFARLFVRAGLCPRPDGDAYILCMASFGLANWPFTYRSRWYGRASADPVNPQIEREQAEYQTARRARTLRTALLEDPELLTWEIWQLFTVPGRRSRMLAPPLKNQRSKKSDHLLDSVLADLSAEGYLDRVRLLDEALAAAARPFPPSQIGWYLALHDRLDPTPTERAERTDAYLHLLNAPDAGAVRFAVENLRRLEAVGQLDPHAFFTEVETVLYTAPKATALLAVGIAKAVLRRNPDAATAGLPVAVMGLAHGHPDVQAAVVGLLEGHELGPDLREDLKIHLGGIDGPLRDRLESVIQQNGFRKGR